MDDAALWKLTLAIVVLALVVGIGGYLWAKHQAAQFDKSLRQHRPAE